MQITELKGFLFFLKELRTIPHQNCFHTVTSFSGSGNPCVIPSEMALTAAFVPLGRDPAAP